MLVTVRSAVRRLLKSQTVPVNATIIIINAFICQHFCQTFRLYFSADKNVTLHHKMSRNVPDGHFHVFIFSESNSMLFTMVKNIFKSEDQWLSYMFLNMVVQH